MNQQEVWDRIARPWSIFRVKPISEVVNFLKGKTGNVLDLGCGSGRNFVKLPEGSKIYAVDFSEKQLEFAREYASKERFEVEIVKAEARKTGFDDNFFDAAVFIAALHCIPSAEEREKSLMELLRVLKPGAEAFITVWDKNQKKFENLKKEAFVPWTLTGEKVMRYYYLYDKEEIISLLEKVGFEVLNVYDRDNPSGLYSDRNIIVNARKPAE